MTPTYDLTTEAWIPAVTATGYQRISLIDAFRDAETTTIAAGPLEDEALHRLLLAITYSALGSPDPQQYPQQVDTSTVIEWLSSHREHFDLLDPQVPFLQDAHMPPDAAIIGPGVLDATLGRERPKITDTRTIADRGPLTMNEAAVYLVLLQLYSQGGRHTGVSASLPESPASGMILFRPAGTIAHALSWARIPVPEVGVAQWTFTPSQETAKTPTGEAEALTWMSRAFLLHHDGQSITGVQTAPGWRRTMTAAEDESAFDTGHGRHDMAVAGSDAKKPAKAAIFDPGAGYRLASGDPIELIVAWERGGPGSLSEQVRTALAADPQLEAPRILATGQQLDKSLWKGAFTTEVPKVTGGYARRAADIVEARFYANRYGPYQRSFGDRTGTALLDTQLEQEPGTSDAVTQLRELLRPRTPDQVGEMEQWPVDAVHLWAAGDRSRAQTLAEAMAALPELAGIPASVLAGDLAATGQDSTLRHQRALWVRLAGDRETASELARITELRIPDSKDIPVPEGFPAEDPGARLWAGLVATWAQLRTPMRDSTLPLPKVLSWAAHGGQDPAPARILRSITTTAPTPSAARLGLLDALRVIARDEKTISWRSLHHDLTHWDQAMQRRWTAAYWEKPTPTTTPTD